MRPRVTSSLIAAALFAFFACDSASPPPSTPGEGTGQSARPDPGSPAPSARTRPRHRGPNDPLPSDFHLATRIRMRLMADDLVDESALRVSVHGAVATLEGTVENGAQSVRAEAIAAATYGVDSVVNRLEGPEPTAAERQRGERVSASVLAVEPGFATALTNYGSGEPVAAYTVVRGPDDVPAIGAVAPGAIPAAELAVESGFADVVALPTGDLPPVEPTGPRRHTIRPGETLWSIARDQMGNGNRWEELFEYNRRVIGDDPNGIRAGMVIRLPR